MLHKINNSRHQQLECQCILKIKKVENASSEEEYIHSYGIPFIDVIPDLNLIDMNDIESIIDVAQ